jgi:hypothetical protein
VVLLCLLLVAAADVRGQSSTATPSDQPTAEQIARAIEKVKADPNLATERTIKTLRWKGTDTAANATGMPRWVLWIVGFFRWVAQTTRVLVWFAVIILMALLVPFVVRLTRAYGSDDQRRSVRGTTHVQSLDIRPETLPANIGAAARALWDGGEHRAALALLYRGLLRVWFTCTACRSGRRAPKAIVSLLCRATSPRGVRRMSVTWFVSGSVQCMATMRSKVERSYPLCDGFAAALDAADSLGASAQGGAA